MKYALILILLSLGNYTFGQKVFNIEIASESPYFHTYEDPTPYQANGLTIHGPRLKDSLPDGIYRVYQCRYYGNKIFDTVIYLEATYVNGVRHGQEIFYGHYYGSRPYLSGITLTEYKNGLVDGMFIMSMINAEGNISITELKQYKNGMQNGISIRAPSGVILEVILYKDDVVMDTLWEVNDSTNIWAMALKQPYFGGEYLQRLLKQERNNKPLKACGECRANRSKRRIQKQRLTQ